MAGTGGITDGVVAGARYAVLDDLAAQGAALARAAIALESAVATVPATPATWRGAAAGAFSQRRDELARRLSLLRTRAEAARSATAAARAQLAA